MEILIRNLAYFNLFPIYSTRVLVTSAERWLNKVWARARNSKRGDFVRGAYSST